jgi:hypothetical protein
VTAANQPTLSLQDRFAGLEGKKIKGVVGKNLHFIVGLIFHPALEEDREDSP